MFLLPDHFATFCLDKPNEIFCRVAEASYESVTVQTKTRAEVLEDARHAAIAFTTSADDLRPRRPGQAPVHVAMLIQNDYAAFVSFLGLLLNRWTPLLISPRIGIDTIVQLLLAWETQCLLVDREYADILASIGGRVPLLQTIIIQETTDRARSDISPDLPPQGDIKDYSSELDCAVYCLHTSGSTGHPKLVPTTHRQWYNEVERLTPYPGHEIMSPTPMIHTTGLACLTRFPFGAQCIPVIIETNQPYTGELLCRVLTHFPGAICIVPPSMLEEIVAFGRDAIAILASAHRLFFAGAALSQTTGDTLATSGVKLLPAFGSTETGQISLADIAYETPLDWQYVRFLDPSQLHLVPIPGSEELCKLIVKPGRFISSSFINHHDPVGFHTGDLWQQHPLKPGLWRHMGRGGIVTVLSNGKKTDNGQLESLIARCPHIQHALVFGEGRLQNGIIVLPTATAWNSSEVIDLVWPTVEEANVIIPAHSHIVKSLIIVADSTRRFALSEKGTVDRRATLRIYDQEIKAAYTQLDAGNLLFQIPVECDINGIVDYIRAAVMSVVTKEVADDADLFDNGMDSLKAITCRSALIPLFKATCKHRKIPRNLLYHCPSIRSLYEYLTSSSFSPVYAPQKKLQQYIEDILGTRTFLRLSSRVEREATQTTRDSGLVVLLTGSTGSFGAQILSALLRSSACRAVYCLNRRSTDVPARIRQQKFMDDVNLLDQYADKITFWDMNIMEHNLGLQDDALQQIRTDVTHIVHCAWDVNFNHPLSHFIESQIPGVLNIIDLSLSSLRAVPPRIVFLSSSATVANYVGPEDSVPEVVHDDAALPLHQGYAQGKYVAERVLAYAAEETDVPVTIVRVGQLSGSTSSGVWNAHEYIPILFETCLHLGLVPDYLPDVRWTPTDVAANVLTDLLLYDKTTDGAKVSVRHIDNAHVVTGAVLVRWLVEASGGSLQPTTTDVWLELVNCSPSLDIPAQRMLGFFELWLNEADHQCKRPLCTRRTREISKAIEHPNITAQLVTKYFEYVQTRSKTNQQQQQAFDIVSR